MCIICGLPLFASHTQATLCLPPMRVIIANLRARDRFLESISCLLSCSLHCRSVTRKPNVRCTPVCIFARRFEKEGANAESCACTTASYPWHRLCKLRRRLWPRHSLTSCATSLSYCRPAIGAVISPLPPKNGGRGSRQRRVHIELGAVAPLHGRGGTARQSS